MEIQNLKDDITVFCIKAESFPDGIGAAHQKLHSILPDEKHRKFFGISYPDRSGKITYKAAVEESYPGEGEKFGCETFIIKKGEYLSETLINWRKDESVVAGTFQKMLQDPRLDSNGYCLEIYPNQSDMICMVKLDSSKVKNQ